MLTRTGYEDVVHLSCTQESIADHSPEAVVLTGDLGRSGLARAPRFGHIRKPDFSGDWHPADREIKQDRRST